MHLQTETKQILYRYMHFSSGGSRIWPYGGRDFVNGGGGDGEDLEFTA